MSQSWYCWYSKLAFSRTKIKKLVNGEITRSCGSESVNHFLNFWKFFFGRVETQTLTFKWYMVIYNKKLKLGNHFIIYQNCRFNRHLCLAGFAQSSVPGELKLTEVVFPSSLICQYCVLTIQYCTSRYELRFNNVTPHNARLITWRIWKLIFDIFDVCINLSSKHLDRVL